MKVSSSLLLRRTLAAALVITAAALLAEATLPRAAANETEPTCHQCRVTDCNSLFAITHTNEYSVV